MVAHEQDFRLITVHGHRDIHFRLRFRGDRRIDVEFDRRIDQAGFQSVLPAGGDHRGIRRGKTLFPVVFLRSDQPLQQLPVDRQPEGGVASVAVGQGVETPALRPHPAHLHEIRARSLQFRQRRQFIGAFERHFVDQHAGPRGSVADSGGKAHHLSRRAFAFHHDPFPAVSFGGFNPHLAGAGGIGVAFRQADLGFYGEIAFAPCGKTYLPAVKPLRRNIGQQEHPLRFIRGFQIERPPAEGRFLRGNMNPFPGFLPTVEDRDGPLRRISLKILVVNDLRRCLKRRARQQRRDGSRATPQKGGRIQRRHLPILAHVLHISFVLEPPPTPIANGSTFGMIKTPGGSNRPPPEYGFRTEIPGRSRGLFRNRDQRGQSMTDSR